MRINVAEISRRLVADFAPLYRQFQSLGFPIEIQINSVLTRYPTPEFDLLTQKAVDGSTVAALWESHVRNSHPQLLLVLFLFEWHISRMPASIAPALRQFRYTKSLHVCRQRLGIAIHDEAREINWQRPVVFVKMLKLGRQYMRYCVRASEFTHIDSRREFTGRLGVATVLINRFERSTARELAEAVDCLIESIDQGNDPISASTYLAEAYVALYDLHGDPTFLSQAIERCERHFTLSPPAAYSFALLDVHLRMFSESSADGGRKMSLDKARGYFDLAWKAPNEDKDFRVRTILTGCLLDACEREFNVGRSLDTRGMEFPFGLRRAGDSIPPTWFAILGVAEQRLVEDVSVRNNALARAVRAELLTRSAIALLNESPGDPSSGRAIRALIESIRIIRDGDDERSRLERARNSLVLAAISRNNTTRRSGINLLIREIDRDPQSPMPWILLAQDVTENGAFRLGGESELEVALQGANVSWLYSEAALRALASADINRRKLGGRGGVSTVEDYFGISSNFIVFKETPWVCLERERAAINAISSFLANRPEATDFSVADILSPAPSSPKTAGSEVVVSIRQFSKGRTLGEHCAYDEDQALATVTRVAKFLAIIHRVLPGIGLESACRNELKKKELRKWLKLGWRAEDSLEIFDAWWTIVENAPKVPRRDAHALNWLVDGEGGIVAVDLDATGFRPVGYDLSQLTDDFAIFEPSSFESREAVARVYYESLQLPETILTFAVLWKCYLAGLICRAVRNLTAPDSDHATRRHGERLLDELQLSAIKEISDLATRIRNVYYDYLGFVDDAGTPLSDRAQQSLSKAMAYQLRHNSALSTDQGGWVDVVELCKAMARGVGQTRCTASDILRVAGNPDEPRFEVESGRIRARYGHTISISLDHPREQLEQTLFHATAMRSLRNIVDEAEGLVPMGRVGVHLSTDAALAIETARRHGTPVLLEIRSGTAKKLLRASEKMWLATHVRMNGIRIVPIWAEPRE